MPCACVMEGVVLDNEAGHVDTADAQPQSRLDVVEPAPLDHDVRLGTGEFQADAERAEELDVRQCDVLHAGTKAHVDRGRQADADASRRRGSKHQVAEFQSPGTEAAGTIPRESCLREAGQLAADEQHAVLRAEQFHRLRLAGRVETQAFEGHLVGIFQAHDRLGSARLKDGRLVPFRADVQHAEVPVLDGNAFRIGLSARHLDEPWLVGIRQRRIGVCVLDGLVDRGKVPGRADGDFRRAVRGRMKRRRERFGRDLRRPGCGSLGHCLAAGRRTRGVFPAGEHRDRPSNNHQ